TAEAADAAADAKTRVAGAVESAEARATAAADAAKAKATDTVAGVQAKATDVVKDATSPESFGLCTAFLNGGLKADTKVPGYQSLVVAAGGE
ncbi:hypothetical protein SB758_34740, partial [Burkholderia sp. SIMBA_013]